MSSACPSRTAIVFYGLLQRSLQFTAPSIRKNLLAPLQAEGAVDVFFHSWEIERIENPRTGEHGAVLATDQVLRLLPRAVGRFEAQHEFDGSKAWEGLTRQGMMRACTDTEDGAQATLMNLIRALESQQRAWRLFLERKDHEYDRVIVTRADLSFLSPVPTHAVGDQLWIPRFHGWGGYNDRFAMGNEELAGLYAQRVAHAEEWVTHNEAGNSEKILRAWLDSRQVRVQPLEIYFARIRADGRIASHDGRLLRRLVEEHRIPGASVRFDARSSHRLTDAGRRRLSRYRSIGRRPVSRSTTDRFLVLSRHAGPAAINLQRALEPLGRTETIVDHPDAASKGVWYPDEELGGFEGMMGGAGFTALTAWSRAFHHLERTLRDDESVWLIEDDVAGPPVAFEALVNVCHQVDPDLATNRLMSPRTHPGWYWWSQLPDPDWFDRPRASFNPLCRFSARLVRDVLALRAAKGRFTFHEVLFASLAFRSGMRILDWSAHRELRPLVGTFRWRPEVREVELSICHPVKDASLHALISQAGQGEDLG